MSVSVSVSVPVCAAACVPATSAVRFLVEADAAPGMLPRLLQPFAKRDLTPDRMWSHRLGDALRVGISLHAAPAEMLHLIEGNLRQIVGVRGVVRIRSGARQAVA